MAGKHRERRRIYNRRFRLLPYGLTEEHYEHLLKVQHGVCAICHDPLAYCKDGKLAVDHEHQTKLVRGLLCTGCNAGLGQFKDSTERLQAAINYLQRHEFTK